MPADVDLCQGQHVIAVNDAFRLAPWADMLYACDDRWWKWHPEAMQFAGLKVTLDTTWHGRAPKDLFVMKNTGDYGLETKPGGLRTGRNSGHQAINLAVQCGAKHIILLGYDMSYSGQSHWFGEHPNQSKPPVKTFLRYYDRLMPELIKAGVSVVNCSRQTALKFPRVSLEQALESRTVV